MIATAVQVALWVVVMVVLSRWITRGRNQPLPPVEAHRLVQPRSILIVGLASLAFSLGCVVASNTFARNDTATIWTTLGFLAFALLGMVVVVSYYTERHALTAEGLDYGTIYGGRRRFTWTQVTRVRYSAVLQYFVIETDDGHRARLSILLRGLPVLAVTVLEQVDPTVIDQRTTELLQRVAAGDVPASGWG